MASEQYLIFSGGRAPVLSSRSGRGLYPDLAGSPRHVRDPVRSGLQILGASPSVFDPTPTSETLRDPGRLSRITMHLSYRGVKMVRA
jgi:hypothetical protein